MRWPAADGDVEYPFYRTACLHSTVQLCGAQHGGTARLGILDVPSENGCAMRDLPLPEESKTRDHGGRAAHAGGRRRYLPRYMPIYVVEDVAVALPGRGMWRGAAVRRMGRRGL